jgi:hypothetical protein
MMRSTRVTVLALGVAALTAGTSATAQRRPPRGRADAGVAAPTSEQRLIPIPVVEASSMFNRMRVWLFTPPAGATAFGLPAGPGERVWALLPSCRPANPDDPRDPCPVGRVEIEIVGGGAVQSSGPVDLAGPNSRRVQSFLVPASADVIRLKLLRNDGTVRYEAAVHRAQLGNLPPPEGSGQGARYTFDLQRYPAS